MSDAGGGATRRALLLCAGALLLGGCATAEKRACVTGAWERLGFDDGRAGLGFERVGKLADRCSDYDIEVDSAAWSEGHARGLEEYCAPVRGYDMGEAGGEDYTGNCPAGLEGRFLSSHVRGLEVRRDELQLAFDRLRRDLDEARVDLAGLAPDDDPDDVEDRIDDAEQALDDNLAARREINATIARWSRRI